jgi:hypothetical protein
MAFPFADRGCQLEYQIIQNLDTSHNDDSRTGDDHRRISGLTPRDGIPCSPLGQLSRFVNSLVRLLHESEQRIPHLALFR